MKQRIDPPGFDASGCLWRHRTSASLWIVLVGMSLIGRPIRAGQTLAQWAASYEKPETQVKILDGIIPGQAGPASAAVKDKMEGTYVFPKGSSWVQLGKEKVWVAPKNAGAPSCLIVTCMLFHRPGDEAMSAVSYLFRSTDRRPIALSAGYASRERVYQVRLPKLGKSYLLLMDSLGFTFGASPRWSASLLEEDENGPSDHPRQVWTSPSSYHTFQLGFAVLNGDAEELVLRTVPAAKKPSGSSLFDSGRVDYRASSFGGSDYAAYRWDGQRFRPDSFASRGRLSALPDNVWRYGAGL